MKAKNVLLVAMILGCISITGCTHTTKTETIGNGVGKNQSAQLLKQELKVKKLEQPVNVKEYIEIDGAQMDKLIFVTSDTCPHCIAMMPYIKQYMQKNPNAVLYEITDKNRAEMEYLFPKYNVEAFPTTVAVDKEDKVMDKVAGEMGLKDIERFEKEIRETKGMKIDKEYGIEFIYSPNIDGLEPELKEIDKFVEKQKDKFTVFKTQTFNNKVLFRAQSVAADHMPLVIIYDKDFNVIKVIENIRATNLDEAQKEIDNLK